MQLARKTGNGGNADEDAKTESDPWVSDRDAADEIGIAVTTVYKLALLSDLEYQVVAGKIFIARKSVRAYMAREERLGRRPTARSRK